MCLDVNCLDRTMLLLEAILREDYELADQLITNGYDLNETSHCGDTPLMWLLWYLDNPEKKYTVCLELLTKLIDAGADVNVKNHDCNTALFYHVHNIYTVKMLIDAGADVNIKNNCGWTALFQTVFFKYSVYTVRMLIDAGADVDIKNCYGDTALLYMVKSYREYCSSVDSVKMLIEADF